MAERLPPAVILAHGSGGLGALRALARGDVPVTVIAFEPWNSIMYSRLASREIAVHGATDAEKEIDLLRILRELPERDAALMASSDRLVTFLSDNRDELLRKFRFVLPPQDVLDALNDKRRETALIESLGFDLPATLAELPPDPLELERRLRYPIILKPHSFKVQDVFPAKNRVIDNRDELLGFYRDNRDAIPVLLAQEVITGPDTYSWVVSCTFDHGHHLLDCGVKQKIRCLPAHFGGSTYAVSRNNEAVVELARDLGEKLEYVGHAGIEFRWDERDGIYKFIELNPRIPANVGFDAGCGLSTVWNSYRVAMNEAVQHSGVSQTQGIYFVDLTGDLASMRADNVPPHVIVISVLKLLFRPTRGLFFSWNDPLPALVVGYRFSIRMWRKFLAWVRRSLAMRRARTSAT